MTETEPRSPLSQQLRSLVLGALLGVLLFLIYIGMAALGM